MLRAHDSPDELEGLPDERAPGSDDLSGSLQAELRSLGLRPTDFLHRTEHPAGFDVRRELSRGGQGVVYEAVQRSTGRRVALKVGLARELGSPEGLERFRREVRLLASLQHEALTTVYESGIDEGLSWLAMEFVEGVELAAWARRTEAGPRAIVALLATVCDAVALAHRHGIVHRDLKPANILVDDDGRPVVVDFGLAKHLSELSDGRSAGPPDVTRAGSIVGSPLWLAPEQVHSPAEVGPPADVYALGRVLYHLLSGAHPYSESPRGREWLRAVENRDPLPLRRVAERPVDPALERIVMKAIERDPARRYRDAGALHADCAAWLEGREISARPDGPLARTIRIVRRHPRGSLLLLALAVSLVATWLVGRSTAPVRWAREVREAAGLSAPRALAELWSRHLDPPSGVGVPAERLSGPALTHYALLARYLAEPCLGRAKLPVSAGSAQMLTARFGDDVVLLDTRESESTLWLGRDGDDAWERLDLEGVVREVQLSPDGRFLCAQVGGTWRLWRLSDTAERSLPVDVPWPGERALAGIALVRSEAQRGEVLALVRDRDGGLRLLRAEDGAEIAVLPRLVGRIADAGAPFQASSSPDGTRLVVWASGEDAWLVHPFEAGATPRRLEGLRGRSFTFLDADTLAVEAGRVRLARLDGDGVSVEQTLFATNNLASPVWLGDGAVAVRCTTSGIEFVPRGMSEPMLEWSAPSQILSFGLVRGGSVLLTHDVDGYLSRWDLSRVGETTIAAPWWRLFPGTGGPAAVGSVLGIAFAPLDDRVAIASVDPPRVLVRGLAGDGEARELALAEGEGPNCLAWSPTRAGLLAAGCLSGRVVVWSTDSPADPVLFGELGGEVHAVAFSPDGHYLLAGGGVGENQDGRIRVWRVSEPGRPLRTLADPAVGRITSLAFDRKGGGLVAGAARSDRPQWLANPLEGSFAPVPDHLPASRRVTRDLVTHATGALSAHRDGTVRLWRGGSEVVSARFSPGCEPFSVDVHPDGALVAIGGADGVLYLLSFDGETLAPAAELPFPAIGVAAGTRRIFRVRFSPDGRFLVVGGEPDTVPCYLDLDEAARCMAGNLPWALARQSGESRDADAARAWAAAVLSAGD